MTVTPEKKLVEWFKMTFASRTPATSVLDAHPSYRVTWHETIAKAKELGYTLNADEMRMEFADIFRRYGLRAWCNRTMKAAGEECVMPRLSAAHMATLKDYRRQS